MRRRAFLAVTSAGATSSGCLGLFEEDDERITDPEDVVIVYDDLARVNPGTEDERVYVFGVVRNEGDRQLSYLEIEATFFDAEGEELDTVIEHVEDATSGEEWSFEIEYPHFGEEAARVADYELEPSTGV